MKKSEIRKTLEDNGIYEFMSGYLNLRYIKMHSPTGSFWILKDKQGNTSFNANQTELIKSFGGRYDGGLSMWVIPFDF